jgi:hypothetical protein
LSLFRRVDTLARRQKSLLQDFLRFGGLIRDCFPIQFSNSPSYSSSLNRLMLMRLTERHIGIAHDGGPRRLARARVAEAKAPGPRATGGNAERQAGLCKTIKAFWLVSARSINFFASPSTKSPAMAIISGPPFVGVLLNSAAQDKSQQTKLKIAEPAKLEIRRAFGANTKGSNIELTNAGLLLSRKI